MTQQTVLITGANRGIGLALTEAYIKDSAKIIATCRNPKDAAELHQLQKNYKDLSIEVLEVTESASRKALAEKLGNTPLDILINNAGVVSGKDGSLCVIEKDSSQTFGTLDPEAWIKVLKTNSIAPVMLSQELLANLENGTAKKIIMISSIMGSIATANDIDCDYMAYNSSKTTLNAAMKCMALHLQLKDYTIAALHPNWVRTRMGSDEATISAEESADKLKAVIAKLTPKQTGAFLDTEAKVIPW